MSDPITCPQCGYVSPPADDEPALAGLCPRCLAGGLGKTDVEPEPSPVTNNTPVRIDTIRAPLQPGAVFKGFEVQEILGQGGMGVVYRARQQSLDRIVALKLLNAQLASSEEFSKRFDREAKVLATLNHPNVVHVHDFGKEAGLLYLVMEHVDGPTLESVMKKKPSDPLRFLTAVRDVALGLQRVHEAGLVHRDIKPSNILMTKDGTAKISDFGLAIETEETQKLTQSGMFVGTPHYVSPEHAQGKKIDGRSDLYSLGVILFEGFAGRPPFQAASATALLLKHVNEAPPALYKLAPQSPKIVQEVVRKLLAKNPASRHDTAASLVRDLDRALEELKAGPKPVPATARKVPAAAAPPAAPKLPVKWIATAAAAALGVVVLLVALRSGKPEPKQEPKIAERRRVEERPVPRPTEEEKPREPEPLPVPVPIVPQTPEPPKAPEPKPPSAVEEAFRQGEKLLTVAKASFEEGKAKSSVDLLSEAAFKAEEAKAKFSAVQEIGGDELKAKGVEQVKLVQQFLKMVHESRLAILNAKGTPAAPAPAPGVPDLAPAAVPGTPAPVVAAPVMPVRKEPLPEAAALKDAEKTVREVYKTDYAKKAPADQQALAQKLLAQARATNDDPRARFVLLREARDLALQAGDLDTLIAALNQTGGDYEFDLIAAKNAALTKIQVRTPEATSALTEALIDLARGALDADNYDVAMSASARADSFPKAAGDLVLVSRLGDLRKEIAASKEEFLKVKSSIDKPGTGDPEAVGKYYAFVKGDWERGLPILAASAKAPLNALAEKDLARAEEVAAQIEIGDGWWDLAEKEKSPLRKARLQERAKSWYEGAAPGALGLGKTKIEKRLEALDALVKGPVDLLKLIDPRIDTINGSWKIEKGSLVSAKEWYGRIQVRYVPPEEYDLRLVVERKDHDEDLIVGLPKGDTQLTANLDAGHGSYSAFGIQAPRADQSPQANGKLFTEGRPAILLCSVRKKSVTVSVDGKKVLTYAWKGDEGRGLIASQWEIPSRKILFVGAHGTSFAVHSMVLIPVSGVGHVDRTSGVAAPPVARPSAAPAPAPKGAVDLLALIDPKLDRVQGDFTKDSAGLLMPNGVTWARLMVPYTAPAEYDLTMVVERRENTNSLNLTLPWNRKQVSLVVDGKGPGIDDVSALDFIDGKEFFRNETTTKGPLLLPGRQHTLVIAVRKTSLGLSIDGRVAFTWTGDSSRIAEQAALNVPVKGVPVVGCYDSGFLIRQMSLTAVSGAGAPIRKAAVLPKGALDLLALLDPAKDAIKGEWTKDAGFLDCPAGDHIRLQIPYAPPDEYDLTIVANRKEGTDGLLVGLARGEVQWAVTMDTQSSGSFKSGFESLDNRGPNDNATTYAAPVFTNGQEITLEFQVRKAGVTVIVGGKRIIEWKGSFNRLSLPDGWKVKSPNALFLAAWGSHYQFSRITLLPYSGPGRKLR